MGKKLCRIKEGKILSGVCGGIAKYFGVAPIVVRVIWLDLFFAYGSGLLLYLLLSLLLVKEI